jgi:hypothetical protein
MVNEVQIPARGQCHIHYKFGSNDPQPNLKAGLCSCIGDWKGSHKSYRLSSEHGVDMYHDTCDATSKPIVRVYRKKYDSTCVRYDSNDVTKCLQQNRKWTKQDDLMVNFTYHRSETGCATTAGVNAVEALGTGPNCCPKGGTSIGDFRSGRGLYWARGQCKAQSNEKTFTGHHELRSTQVYRLGEGHHRAVKASNLGRLEVENAKLRKETNVLKEQALEAFVLEKHQTTEIQTLKAQLAKQNIDTRK